MTKDFKLTPEQQIIRGIKGYEKPITLEDAVNLLNEYQDRIDELEDDNQKYHLGKGQPLPENPRWKQTLCTAEIHDTLNNHFYWLELDGNVEEICRILNNYERIKDTIKEAYTNERTALGKSVLRQLLEKIQ